MFKNDNVWAKLTIGSLFALLVYQSSMYYSLKNNKTMEVEAKICKVENVVCVYSQQLTELGTSNTPTYICMEATGATQ